MTELEVQRRIDEEHLRLLRIGYLVSGTVSAVFAVFPLFYVGMGILFASALPGSARPGTGDLDPRVFGWLFAAIGIGLFVFLAAGAAFKFVVARAIQRRRMHTLCLIGAAWTCLGIPWGTVLGILTFIVLERPGVKSLFSPARSPAADPFAPAEQAPRV
jgi:hypothetical protein